MPSCSAIDLAEIRRSSKISSWIWSIISGVGTVLGRSGRGASEVEKSPRLYLDTQFLTVACDGSCSPNISVRMAYISFGASPCRGGEGGGIDESSRLHVVEIARVAWHASYQPLYQEKTCNSAHEQTPLSNDTIDSVLRHREVGRAKDLSTPPRNNCTKHKHAAWKKCRIYYIEIRCYICIIATLLWMVNFWTDLGR